MKKQANNVWSNIMNQIKKMKNPFRFEDVDVTFKMKGNRMTYTYCKVADMKK